MYELIYTSAETQAFTPADLAAMLRVARENNAAAHVTGILLYHQGSFMQVLEGEQSSSGAT
jgi:Sensors of blue-light using FAD